MLQSENDVENDVEWSCESEQEKSFQRLKALAMNAPTLKFYDVKKPTLSVDASSEGMGAVLLQDHRLPASVCSNREGTTCNCIWQRHSSRKRSQATREHIQKTSTSDTIEAAKDVAQTPKVQSECYIQAGQTDAHSRCIESCLP